MRTEGNTQHPTGEKKVCLKEEMALWFAKVNCCDATLEELEKLHLQIIVRHPRSANDGKLHWHFIFKTDSTRAQTVNGRIREKIAVPTTTSLKGSELIESKPWLAYILRHHKQKEQFPSAMYKVYDDFVSLEQIEEAIKVSKLKPTDIPEVVNNMQQANHIIQIDLNPKRKSKWSLFAEIKSIVTVMYELNPNKCKTLEDVARIALHHFKETPRDIPRADIMRAIIRGVWYHFHQGTEEGKRFEDKCVKLWSYEE